MELLWCFLHSFRSVSKINSNSKNLLFEKMDLEHKTMGKKMTIDMKEMQTSQICIKELKAVMMMLTRILTLAEQK
jgi:hypothetical protein